MRNDILRQFVLLILIASLFSHGSIQAQAIPGVRVVRDADRSLLPPGYDLTLIEIDWTEPRLRAELLAPPRGLRWDDAASSITGAVLIQLAEPRPTNDGRFVSALPVFKPGEAGAQPRVEIGGLIPFLPCGGPIVPPWSSPLAGGAAGVGVAWMGRSDEFEKFPELVIRDRCIISWTDPVRDRTTFALLARRAGDDIKTAELKSWLKSRVKAGRWLALHATGEHALGYENGKLLGPTGAPRFIGRVGAALVLRPATENEPVDLVRKLGATIMVSSFDGNFQAQSAVMGRLLPSPLEPSAWVSRPRADGEEPAWFKVQLPRSAPPAREIRIFWAMAAGWSSHFNPGRCRLEIDEGDGEFKTVLEIVKPGAPVTIWKPREPISVRAARLVFNEPTQMPVETRARLAGLQIWD
ncbi:hypothetical protein LLG95_15745 [bacterium]|nr:hypothetical protein [bacterium]